MMSVDLAGEASFSTLNIRRSGQMAPEVESGAFWFSRAGLCATGLSGRRCGTAIRTQWSRRSAGRARVLERGALECKGSGRGTRTLAAAAKQAWTGDRRGRGDRRSGCHSGRPALRARRSFPFGRAGHRRTDVTIQPKLGFPKLGFAKLYFVTSAGAGATFHGSTNTAHGSAGQSNPGRSNPGRSNPGRSNPGRSNHRPAGGQLLVDSAVGGGTISRANTNKRRGCPLLACSDRRQQVSFDTSWRPQPHLRRPGRSSSSHLDRDVPSASLRLAES